MWARKREAPRGHHTSQHTVTGDLAEKHIKEDEEDVSASKTPRLESPAPSPVTTTATTLPTGAPVNGLPYVDQWAAWAQHRMATNTIEQQTRMQIMAAAQQQWVRCFFAYLKR